MLPGGKHIKGIKLAPCHSNTSRIIGKNRNQFQNKRRISVIQKLFWRHIIHITLGTSSTVQGHQFYLRGHSQQQSRVEGTNQPTNHVPAILIVPGSLSKSPPNIWGQIKFLVKMANLSNSIYYPSDKEVSHVTMTSQANLKYLQSVTTLHNAGRWSCIDVSSICWKRQDFFRKEGKPQVSSTTIE